MMKIGTFRVGRGEPLAIIAGPCVIESEEHCLRTASELKEIFSELEIPFIFKASYDKANRTSVHSFRGPGLQEGLRILEKVKRELDLPIQTDIHSPEDARAAGEVIDVLQIPAFLCRQTDLLVAAGETGRVIGIKKGQFIAPANMGPAVEKVRSTGNDQIFLMERGTCFGYNNLVTDLRAIPIMQREGVPVCFDATHSVQLPAGHGETTAGEREFAPVLAKGAVAAGADMVFLEAHPNPAEGKSDATTMLDFPTLRQLARDLKELHELIQQQHLAHV